MSNIVKKQELTWYKLEDMPEEWKDQATILCQEYNGALFLGHYIRDEVEGYFWNDGSRINLFCVEFVALIRK